MHVLEKGMRGRMARHLRSREGFTLVELMVMVVVIAILATAVGFASTIGSSSKSNMKSDAKSVHTALVEHFVGYNRFPLPSRRAREGERDDDAV